MDPIGRQKKIASSEYRQGFQKLVSGGGAKKNYDGISFPKSTRAADSLSPTNAKMQGKVSGKHTHTYGANGKGDPE